MKIKKRSIKMDLIFTISVVWNWMTRCYYVAKILEWLVTLVSGKRLWACSSNFKVLVTLNCRRLAWFYVIAYYVYMEQKKVEIPWNIIHEQLVWYICMFHIFIFLLFFAFGVFTYSIHINTKKILTFFNYLIILWSKLSRGIIPMPKYSLYWNSHI